MRVAVAREVRPGERRVALTPETTATLVASGATVVLEAGAGISAVAADEDYRAAGAEVIDGDVLADADVVLHVRPLLANEIGRLRPGTVTIGFMTPSAELDGIRALRDAGVTAFSMELVPRISRAQSMDALTSQALVSGYRCALEAAMRLPRFFPLFMTAAGTVPPAKVLVLGAGVAGLQAIATAKRLGAVVEDRAARQRELLAPYVAKSDVLITTAAVPGRTAPLLVTRDMVAAMRAGSVVIDLAAETGGNVEGSIAGQEVDVDGVVLFGMADAASTMPADASRLYAKNVINLLGLMQRDGELVVDLDDEVLAGACVVHDGVIRHEPTRELIEGPAQPAEEATD
jgi:H+-translocating NAD(P) transhydrogenase subunit alpha